MKYWKDSEIQYIEYLEGCRVLPFKYPASISTAENMRVEIEIIPGTSSIRKYICPNTFEMLEGMCIKVERRIWRDKKPMFCENFWVPIHDMGYEVEPNNYSAFENAMKIV